MEVVVLNVEARDKSRLAKHLRYNDLIPGVVYGGGKEHCELQMDYQIFRKVFIHAGENTIIDLCLGEGEPKKVLVHKVDYDPVTGKIAHVDFINVRMDQEVHTHIPLHFVGTAPAVKDLGGTLTENITELEIKCMPGDLIHSIEVDISGLIDFHAAIHVRDLAVPSTIHVLDDPEAPVASVAPPRVEEVEPVVAETAVVEGEGAAAEGEAKEEGEE